MSGVPLSKRGHSKLEAQALAMDIRKEITSEIMGSFGYSQRKYEAHVRAMTDYIQDNNERLQRADTIRQLEENFSGWFIVKERDRLFKLACDLPAYLRAANAIYPKYGNEYELRRLYMDKAIACCYRMQEELQYAAETLPADCNKFTHLVLTIEREANLIKKLRRSDEKRFGEL